MFVTSGDDGMVRVFRSDTLSLFASIQLDLGANRVEYDPHKNLLYVGYGTKDGGRDYGQVAIIDAKTAPAIIPKRAALRTHSNEHDMICAQLFIRPMQA